MSTFAENVNRMCAKKGTTLTSVIKQVKNGQSAYTTAINKKGSIPNQEDLLKMAEILDCSVMDFFADDEDLKMSYVIDNEDIQEIIEGYPTLSRQQQHRLMAYYYNLLNGDV